MNEKDLKDWCENHNQKKLDLLNPSLFRLENYRIGFTRYSIGRKGGVADIISSTGDFCYGVIFDVRNAELDVLDIKEGVKSGDYRRLHLSDKMIT